MRLITFSWIFLCFKMMTQIFMMFLVLSLTKKQLKTNFSWPI